MRIIDPYEIKRRRAARVRRTRVRRSFIVVVLLVFISGYTYIAFQRPLPQVQAVSLTGLGTAAKAPALAWPAYGQAAVGAQSFGLLSASPSQKSAPMASTAKVMTALSVLRKKPITPGQQGETLTLTENDVALYNYYANNDGSNVAVQAGEQITEYQALQALLLPSANNIADTLATWAFGSMDAYLTYANATAKTLGMDATHFSDASGFSAQTVSSASDLVILGSAAMQNPILAEIVGQSHAVIPVAGNITNVNTLLGKEGIIGIKTGNTDQAGGCFLAAVSHTFSNGQKLTFVAAVMGAPTLGTAMNASVAILNDAYKQFVTATVIHAGEVVGTYKFPWAKPLNIIADKDVSVLTWAGKGLQPKIVLNPVSANATKGDSVGRVSASSTLGEASTTAVLQSAPPQPSLLWRLFHF